MLGPDLAGIRGIGRGFTGDIRVLAVEGTGVSPGYRKKQPLGCHQRITR